ncbi:MAG: hypothetical protein RL441_1121 [Actinomycetota bacterium]
MTDHSQLSLWWDQVSDAEAGVHRSALTYDIDVDVCIVGAGYTGLWTALWLLENEPSLSIAIVEAEVAGFGASGRNGGWCSPLFPASMDNMEARVGATSARAMQQAMFDNLDVMQAAIERHGIDCDWELGGSISLIRSKAQQTRAVDEMDYWRRWGFGDDYYQLLSASEALEILDSPETLGAVFTPLSARIHPAKLARNLAHAVERLGARIYENSPVREINPGSVQTDTATVRATWVVNAIEAWQSQRDPRSRIPVYSLMIATQPLTESQWAEIGLENGQTFADLRNLIIYGQRTADGRLAFGGRGAPYHWGSRIDPSFDTNAGIHHAIENVLFELLPQIRGVEITHRWGGPLGIHRDWHPSIQFEQNTKIVTAGGYVGDGVAATHLAGRTIADGILGRTSDLMTLPWVNHHNPRWEPEPIRWLGANAGLRAMTIADTEECWTRRPSLSAKVFNRFLGH